MWKFIVHKSSYSTLRLPVILIPIHLPLFPNLLNKLKAEYTIEEVLKMYFCFLLTSRQKLFPNHTFLWAVLTEPQESLLIQIHDHFYYDITDNNKITDRENFYDREGQPGAPYMYNMIVLLCYLSSL